MWTGQLRLSLVSFGVRLYAATETARRVSMNQLHQGCNQRVRNQLVCPNHGPIARDQIAKGYEYEKDSYVIVEQSDIDSIKLPTTKHIEIVQFVDADEIEPQYFNAPYFLGPDGPVAEEAFRVIREAMSRARKVAIGKFVLHGREHIVAIQVQGKGLLMSTLRYASEVRSGEQFFADVKDGKVAKEQIELAQTIMEGKVAPFDPSAFHDAYADAFFKIVKAKIEGETPVFVEEEESPRAFNFMEALKKSVDEAGKGAAAKKTRKKAPAKSAKKTKKPAAKSVGRTTKKRRKGA
jgi:DNA end-binding protein Ku